MEQNPAFPARIRRADPRYTLDRPARLVVVERAPVAVRLINLSRGGFRVACPLRLPAGQEVRIEVDGWPRLVARVIWCDAGRIGCMFSPSPSDAIFAIMERAALAREPE